jgi:hypothetical protein
VTDPWKPGRCTAVPVGSHPATVAVGETRVVVIAGRREEVRKVEVIPYDAWSGRCLVCFPSPGRRIHGEGVIAK